MNTFYLRVISSNKIFFDGRAEKIVLPLEDGEKAVLAHHENMVIATSIGEIRITTSKGEQVVGVVGEGFVQIVNNRVVLIVDSAEKPEDIDRVRAKEAKIRAEESQAAVIHPDVLRADAVQFKFCGGLAPEKTGGDQFKFCRHGGSFLFLLGEKTDPPDQGTGLFCAF